jgi:hypothetical protein
MHASPSSRQWEIEKSRKLFKHYDFFLFPIHLAMKDWPAESTSVTRISALGSHVFANMHGIDCKITKPQCTYVNGWIMANITNNQLVVKIGRSYRACHPSMYMLYRIRPMQTVEWFSWAPIWGAAYNTLHVFYRIGPMQTIEWFSWAPIWGAAYNIKVLINIGLAHDHCSTWVSGFKSSCSCLCMPSFLHCDRVFPRTQSVRDHTING